jgi:hypothetical protein
MTQALPVPQTAVVERHALAAPVRHLARVLDEVAQATVPREQTPQRPTPAPARMPRPVASD